ncbi:MAG: hydrogenase maturation nickel metallochaperone HypA [Desulfobulbaceae bacterium]
MHELSLARGLLDQLHRLARQHDATKIHTVRVTIGRLSGIVPDSFSFGFEALSAENPLTNGATLEITLTEPQYRCLDCAFEGEHKKKNCPRCGSTRLLAVGGDELVLTRVEME